MVEIAFTVAHQWLKMKGLKLDQVKNELIHFTRSTRGRHAGEGPSITIPTNTPGELKMVKPAKSICYLGIVGRKMVQYTSCLQSLTLGSRISYPSRSYLSMHFAL